MTSSCLPPSLLRSCLTSTSSPAEAPRTMSDPTESHRVTKASYEAHLANRLFSDGFCTGVPAAVKTHLQQCGSTLTNTHSEPEYDEQQNLAGRTNSLRDQLKQVGQQYAQLRTAEGSLRARERTASAALVLLLYRPVAS